jgi:hypothetical protein
MALVVFATLCFLACTFLLFVLVKWMRDGKRKARTRSDFGNIAGETNEERKFVVRFPGTMDRRDRPEDPAHNVSGTAKESCGPESREDDRERIAYERIARFSKPGKTT